MGAPTPIQAPPRWTHAGCPIVLAMDLQLLEHRVLVTSIDKAGLRYYFHELVKLVFLPHRSRCKFFSLTETPEDYTLMLDEEGFKELPPSDFLHVAENTWRVLNVLSNSCSSSGVQNMGVTKIAKSVISPLAESNVSVLMLSTYQTDYILVREDDLPVVFSTLLGELTIYTEENGDLVKIEKGHVNMDVKKDIAFSQTVHPIQSPKNRFCILSLNPDSMPSISITLLDVLFYSQRSPLNSPANPEDPESFCFFAFSYIDGYISIVMDAEVQKRFPTDLLLTSSSGELWRMVRIGGQPLGFDECGIVAQIAGPLADADLSAYYISTFNYDHALVPEENIDAVIDFLRQRQENQS
ncbi:cytosolic arginine sensor for mTORC1 subunit 1 [Pelodytes ibericus]